MRSPASLPSENRKWWTALAAVRFGLFHGFMLENTGS